MEYDKKHIGLLFDRIASHYDSINHLFSLNIDRLWRRRLVLTMEPTSNVLDVATGTGDLAIQMCRHHRAEQVVGLDLSSEMMRLAADKAKGLPIRFVQGSALEMPFQDHSMDAVTCSFGCRNFSDLDGGLREMARVLRPGGQLLILEFSYPSHKVLDALYDFYFSRIMPTLCGMISHDRPAFRYFNSSVKHFIWGAAFCERLTQAGFSDVRCTPLTGGIASLYTAHKS